MSKRETDENRTRASYRKEFAGHVIADRGDGWWELQNPAHPWNFWTRFIVVPSRLILVGDGPDMTFRTYLKESPTGLIRWLADSNLDYLSSKVVAGKTEAWDEDVAREDLELWVSEMKSDHERHGPEDGPWEEPEWVETARECLSWDYTEHEFRKAVVEGSEDCELGEHWGRVWTPHFIAAQELAKRLVECLAAEGAKP